jgi:DNA replication protein DnaD
VLLAAGKDNFDIVGTINLDNYKDSLEDLYLTIASLRQAEYLPNQRIIISSTVDYYTQSTHGILLQSLQTIVNAVDISNFFICFITTNVNIKKEYQYVLDTFSTDLVPFEIQIAEGKFSK